MYKMRRKDDFIRQRVLLIGETIADCIDHAEKLHLTMRDRFAVEGMLEASEREQLPIKLQTADVVLISQRIKDKTDLIRLCAIKGKEVLVIPDLLEMYFLKSIPRQLDDVLVLSIQPPPCYKKPLILKRMFDVVGSLLLLVIFSPTMLFLWAVIPLTSRGPAVYKQERVGLNGKPYWMYKFRSLVQNAEQYTGPVLVLEKDPRITRIGRWIRATRFDELPQLLNVLKGEMSLVGPRPERFHFVRQYQETIPNYLDRLTMKPGITGLAQVMAKYSSTVEDKLRFDLLYIVSYSFLLDLKILLQTFHVIFRKDSSRGIKMEQRHDSSVAAFFHMSQNVSSSDKVSQI